MRLKSNWELQLRPSNPLVMNVPLNLSRCSFPRSLHLSRGTLETTYRQNQSIAHLPNQRLRSKHDTSQRPHVGGLLQIAPKVTKSQKRAMKKQPLKRGSRTSKSKAKGEFTLQIRAFREAKDATISVKHSVTGGTTRTSSNPRFLKRVWYRVRIGEFSTLKPRTFRSF